MSEKSREHISSLMDGEVSAETGRFLLRRMGSDDELCATWARYHLVRDCLRHPEDRRYDSELCRRVNRALRDEPPASAGFAASMRGWLRPVAGGAIAATVALMAVMAVGPARSPAPAAPVGDVARAEPTASFVTPSGLGRMPASLAVSARGSVADDRINHYLLRHYQATGGQNGRGLVTFVPVMVQAAPPAEEAPAEAEADSDTARQ